MDKYCFIYNPGSRRGRSKKELEKLRHYTRDWSGSEVFSSTRYEDLRGMAEDAAAYFDVVVACGGDGTVREVGAGLVQSGTRMGIIPMGSGNDYAKSVGIPHDLKAAVGILAAGKSIMADIGTCNDFYFMNTLGFGFDGLTNLLASKSIYLNGMAKYIWAALNANFSMDPFHAGIQVNRREEIHSELLMVTASNGRVEGGSFRVAPDARLDDGKLDLVTVEALSKFVLPFLLPLFWWGRQDLMNKYSCIQVAECRLKFERPPYLHADGEVIHTRETEFAIGLIPGAIEVIGLV